jgi:pimeloyl-ACP methyl ester carboxylesterase
MAAIRELVLMAPATAWFTPDGALAEVTVPILVYHAEHDTLTPFENVERILEQVPDKGRVTVHHVENAGHLSFLSPFPKALVTPEFIPAQDPEGFDRVAFHQRLTGEVVEFLDGVFA